MAIKITVSKKCISAASAFPVPLYLVGGYVRNSILGLCSEDRDVCSKLPAEEAVKIFESAGFHADAVYPRLGTVKLSDPETGENVEYTTFRAERYAPGGGHTPCEVTFGGEIEQDALRRDFAMNAIYYGIAEGEFTDPLGGIGDLKCGRIRCADAPEKVFGSDGLRLLRLVRFSAELGLEPTEETLRSAYACRDRLSDIVPERIAEEFYKICFADVRYPSRNLTEPHLRGLLLCDRLGLLEQILPELTAGKGLTQRRDFHRYDVFGHSAETFRVSPPEIRIAALLHDIGKPVRYAETGRFYGHDEAGGKLAGEISRRAFGLSKRESSRVSELVSLHMYDLDGETGENKLRRFFAEHSGVLEDLMRLKQADYLGGGLCSGECPTAIRWRKLLETMKAEGAPLRLSELAVGGNDVRRILPELPEREIGGVLDELFGKCVLDGSLNRRETLIAVLENRQKRQSRDECGEKI